MAYASKLGRARVNPRYPQAAGVCDRCGAVINHIDLRQQTEYAGAGLVTFNLLVCDGCLDVPQPQKKSIAIPADPLPVLNPRTQNYDLAAIDQRYTSSPPLVDSETGIPIPQGSPRATEDGSTLAEIPFGLPNGLEQAAIMPLNGTRAYGVKLPVVSIFSAGSDQITVTCSAAHNLATNDQISVEGLSNGLATGFYSVSVISATAFTYQTYNVIPLGSLLTSTTRLVTAIVGLPRGF